MKTIRIIKVDEGKTFKLQIGRSVVISKAGAFYVKLVKQAIRGILNDGTNFSIELDKQYIWLPPSSVLKSTGCILIEGKYLNPILKTAQLNKLRQG